MDFCCGCFTGSSSGPDNVRMRVMPTVKLDTKRMGGDCVIVKNCLRVCGSGGVYANAPLQQNKSYFEIKLQALGAWGIGVGTKGEDVQNVPLGKTDKSWVLRSDGSSYHNDEAYSKMEIEFEEGNIIGCSYDHIELKFYLNGKPLESATVFTVRGTVWPIFYVDDGAILDCVFKDFESEKPRGYQEIMFEQDIL